MSSKLISCKETFEAAYNNRYTWPKYFHGYKGNFILINNEKSYSGNFSINKDFKVKVTNLEKEDLIKDISSQLFEVSIHRVKRDFDQIHSENGFELINKDEKGIEMIVSGKNQGDKYRIKDNALNMVFRKINGIIIEIFVEEFYDTGSGLLSKRYTSQQLDQKTLKPLSPIYNYEDKFENVDNKLWLLTSRQVSFLNSRKYKETKKYFFNNLILLS